MQSKEIKQLLDIPNYIPNILKDFLWWLGCLPNTRQKLFRLYSIVDINEGDIVATGNDATILSGNVISSDNTISGRFGIGIKNIIIIRIGVVISNIVLINGSGMAGLAIFFRKHLLS